VSGDAAKLKVFTMVEDLELIAALDQRTWSLQPEALGCGRLPNL
jgi:hypothetical protein